MSKKIKKEIIKNIINSKIFKITGFIILLLFSLQEMFYFIIIKKISFINWIMINPCVSIALPIFFLGFLLNNKIIKVISAVFMFRYAILSGIYIFFNYGWASKIVIENINKILDIVIIGTIFHIIMGFLAVTIIMKMVKQRKIKEIIIGLVLGIIFLAILFVNEQIWFNNNPKIIEELFLNIKGV